jgi:hypothetical protein
MEFIISIDTEGDNQWEFGSELTVENIRYVPRFQELCEKFNMKPTYLVTSEVCADTYARQIFTDYWEKDTAEIGAHLHLWTTAPFYDKDGYRFNDPGHGFANELPPDMLREKLKTLTHEINDAFGKMPTSFRSGRYGFDEEVGKALAELGYLVDSSVTPLLSWAGYPGIPGGKGGPDFIRSTPFPYHYHYGDKSLFEIPVSILATRYPLNRYTNLSEYFFRNVDKSLPLKVLRKLFFRDQPLWFRPNPWMTMGHFEELLAESDRIGLPCIVMMFHSSELMPGCSIYRPDNESIEKLYKLLEDFFILLNNKQIASVTLTEAAKNTKV